MFLDNQFHLLSWDHDIFVISRAQIERIEILYIPSRRFRPINKLAIPNMAKIIEGPLYMCTLLSSRKSLGSEPFIFKARGLEWT